MPLAPRCITDLTVGYGPVQVLFGLSLSVGKGECLAVLGPNGAGKTTLLATISGFLSPRAGHIRLEGSEIGGRPPHAIVRAGISQVMQGRQILGPMSVRDNLLLGAHLRLPREGRAAVDASLRYVYGLFPVLAERRSKTEGAIERARADIAAAEARTAEYEQRLREARMALFKRQEERRRMALQARSAAVAEARAKAQAQVSQARAAIEQDKTAAQTALQAEAGRLATEIVRTVLQPVSAAVQTPVGGGL